MVDWGGSHNHTIVMSNCSKQWTLCESNDCTVQSVAMITINHFSHQHTYKAISIPTKPSAYLQSHQPLHTYKAISIPTKPSAYLQSHQLQQGVELVQCLWQVMACELVNECNHCLVANVHCLTKLDIPWS